MHARVVLLGVGKGVLFREVSSVQERPHRERERERFHCTHFYSNVCRCVHIVCTPTRMSRRRRSNALSVESVGSGVRIRKEVGRSVNWVLDSDGIRVRMERSEVD